MTANVGFFNNNREVTSASTMPYRRGGLAQFSLDNAVIDFDGTYLLGGDLSTE